MACAIGLPNVRKRRAAELADDAGIREFSAAIVSFRPDVCFNALIAVIKPEKRTVRLTLKFRFLEQPDPCNPRRSRMDAFVCVVPIHAAQRINLFTQLARLL
jgi:hypothetical protein